MTVKTNIARGARSALFRTIQEQDDELRKILIRAARNVDKIIADLPGEGIGTAVRTAMYRQQSSSIYALVNEMWSDQVGPSVLAHAAESASLAIASQTQVLATLLSNIDMGVLADSFMASARSTYETVRGRMLNQMQLSPRVYQNAALSRGKIDDLVNNGIALGKSAREIASDVKDFIRPDVPGGASYAAMRLGRTELNNAFHQVNKESYRQSPFVEGVQWNLSGSHPIEDDCNVFSEQNDFGLGDGVFPPDEVPDLPHANCLCGTTAVTPSPEQFVENLLDGQYDCGG